MGVLVKIGSSDKHEHFGRDIVRDKPNPFPTEKVPQKTCVTKFLPNFRANFPVQLASKSQVAAKGGVVKGGVCKRKRTRASAPKTSSERVFLNNFRWFPALYHREEGKSSRECFEKISCNRSVFGYFGILGGLSGLGFFPPAWQRS